MSRLMDKLRRLRPRGVLEALRKHGWALAFIVACLLTFLGPTYVIYVLYALDLSWPVPDILGFALFSAGLIWVAHLVASRAEGGGQP